MEDPILCENHLYNIDRASKRVRIWTYDLDSAAKSHFYISKNETLNFGTSIALLPQSELFCYGNHEPISGISCIIDLKSWKIKKTLPSWTPCYFAGSIYYKNSIYMFGGYNGVSLLCLASKFDINENKWFQITPLPMASSLCACTVFKNSIIICGYEHSKVYKYDVQIESYSELPVIDLRQNFQKILFEINSRIYILIKNGKILESEVDNEYAWSIVGNSQFVYYNNCFWVNHKGSIYISLHYYREMHCYKFCLKKKILENLSSS
ncbi:unnamed protein product [Blepharisma stoltei]|uniref:Uncharacterized protein n=1 Tax=Blepharisma stoltei TaxID=1481888 RepID=A0AAU9JAS9_9CILI|nr:unnamed protein product [Blepharisma stoltei]